MQQFQLVNEHTANGLLIREYLVLADGAPVDRFSLFRVGSRWVAWTGDTISQARREARTQFAAHLSE